jgi:hypothetical protein
MRIPCSRPSLDYLQLIDTFNVIANAVKHAKNIGDGAAALLCANLQLNAQSSPPTLFISYAAIDNKRARM